MQRIDNMVELMEALKSQAYMDIEVNPGERYRVNTKYLMETPVFSLIDLLHKGNIYYSEEAQCQS